MDNGVFGALTQKPRCGLVWTLEVCRQSVRYQQFQLVTLIKLYNFEI